jgi:hypothetical protein
MDEQPQGLTVLGRCGLRQPCLRLVADHTRSYEWESLSRREPRRAKDRLAPLRPWRYIPRQEDRR